MIKKRELLRALSEAIEFEERIQPKLEEQIFACFSKLRSSKIVKEDKKRIRELLFQLLAESNVHRKDLMGLINGIENDEKENY